MTLTMPLSIMMLRIAVLIVFLLRFVSVLEPLDLSSAQDSILKEILMK
jgi:hypothetical protein